MLQHILLYGSLLGPFWALWPVWALLSLFYSTNYLLCILNSTWLGMSSSPAWLELQGAGRQDTDSLLETWLLVRVEARQNSGSVLEMTQAQQGFLVMTVSAPVSPTLPQTLFCQEVSHDWIANVKACRAASYSLDPEPSEGDGDQDRESHAGKRTPRNSQWLNSQSFSLAGSLSLLFPLCFFFFFFMLYLQQGSAGRGAQGWFCSSESQRPPTEGDFLSACASTFTWV